MMAEFLHEIEGHLLQHLAVVSRVHQLSHGESGQPTNLREVPVPERPKQLNRNVP